MLLITIVSMIVNAALSRDKSAWAEPYQFSVHAYAAGTGTGLRFTGPFMSDVHVLPSSGGALVDKSTNTHLNCTSYFYTDKVHMQKCKIMRSAPMFLGNIATSWSLLGVQSTSTLAKHLSIIFLVFFIFWCCEYALTDKPFPQLEKMDAVYTRNIVVFLSVVAFAVTLALDVTSDMSTDAAIGSVSTAFAVVVVCLLVICFEYAGMHGKHFVVDKKEVTEDAAATRQPELQQSAPVKIIKPKHEYMHRNIYMSYVTLLMFPLVVVFVLAHSHDAIVDVHIQLVFFSFVFYATLDVFQTRTTAVLACLQEHYSPKLPEEPTDEEKLQGKLDGQLKRVKIFVVLAFCLCKCFVLMPALVLLQTQYNERAFQRATLAVHYVVLIGFALADLLHITLKKVYDMTLDMLKLLMLVVYVCFIFIAMCFVDPAK
jgi:hypothetical protein